MRFFQSLRRKRRQPSPPFYLLELDLPFEDMMADLAIRRPRPPADRLPATSSRNQSSIRSKPGCDSISEETALLDRARRGPTGEISSWAPLPPDTTRREGRMTSRDGTGPQGPGQWKELDPGLIPGQFDGTARHGELVVMELEPRTFGNLRPYPSRRSVHPYSGLVAWVTVPAQGSGHRLGPEADTQHRNLVTMPAPDEVGLGRPAIPGPGRRRGTRGPRQDHEIISVVGKRGGSPPGHRCPRPPRTARGWRPLLQMGPHPLRCGQRIVFDDESAHGRRVTRPTNRSVAPRCPLIL